VLLFVFAVIVVIVVFLFFFLSASHRNCPLLPVKKKKMTLWIGLHFNLLKATVTRTHTNASRNTKGTLVLCVGLQYLCRLAPSPGLFHACHPFSPFSFIFVHHDFAQKDSLRSQRVLRGHRSCSYSSLLKKHKLSSYRGGGR
jgi:hypothetical protein